MIYKKAIAVVAVLVSVLFPVLSTAGTWTTKAPMPTSRFSPGAASVNGIIYAIGGDVDYYGCGPTAANEAYDPATNTWTAKAPLPTSHMTHFSVAVLDGSIYVIGGNPACVPATTTVEAYDPVSNTWTTKAPLPHGVGAAAAGVVNGILYVAGGTDNIGPLTGTLYAYDPGTNAWSTKAPMPDGHYIGAGAVVNGIFYVVGGGNATTLTAPTFAYDPTSDTWSTKASMNVPRAFLSAAVVNNKIYAIGGVSSGNNFETTTEVYDPATDTWTELESMPTGRQDLAVAEANGTIYAIGGLTASLGAGLATVEAYTPDAPETDTTPDPFTFTPQTGVALNTAIISNTITVSGINAPSPISITDGTYSINGGAYTSGGSVTVNNGDTVTVRVVSWSANLTTKTAMLTIGGVSGSFSVTTMGANTPPSPSVTITQSGWTVTVKDNSTDLETAQSALEVTVDWGNGSTSTGNGGETFTKSYAVAGTYILKQRVRDEGRKLSYAANTALTVPVKYQVAGRVMRLDGTTPVSGASVRLKIGASVKKMTTTNATGNYTFMDVVPDSYTVETVKSGLTFSSTPAAVVTSGDVTGVNITATR